MIQASSSRALPARHRAAGFTLIELMITVAIIGILAAVALPSYKSYIRRGQQPEALNQLSDYRTRMEQYYQDNRNYGSSATSCADAATGSISFTPNGAKYFAYTCVADTAAGDTTQQSYLITATGTGGQVLGDKYTIDQNGNRTTLVFRGTTLSPAATCWLTSSSSC